MSYILITNSDGVSLSLVHADDEGAYLAHHGVKGQRWGLRRYQNPDGSLTEKGKRRMKTLQGKSDKLDAKKAKLNSPKNMVKLSQYKSLSADRHAEANKFYTKYVQQAKKAAKYDDYIAKHQNKESKIDSKKINVESNLNTLKEIDAEYARSLAEKVDKRKDKK